MARQRAQQEGSRCCYQGKVLIRFNLKPKFF
jgi:hypothetical protein